MEHHPQIEDGFAAIVRMLVDRPEDVAVVIMGTARGTVLQLRVHPTDVGKVVGKRGRTAQSLRVLLNAVCSKCGADLALDIVEGPNNPLPN
jgi:predicted RNA-binding protein YlqC (UPF0109 family)